MDLQIPLDKMTTSEKLRAIEQIWEDLCRTPEKLPSPKWHEEVLVVREQRLRDGSSELIEWPTAKQRIRDIIK